MPRRGEWLQWSAIVLLHALLFVGLYQSGFTRDEVRALVKPGPYKLVEPYLRAAERYGPWGPVRVYFFGEGDERLYLEYARLLLQGELDLSHVEKIQHRSAAEAELPSRAWPYRDVTVEYPPLAFLAFVPPALFSTDYAVYRHLFAAWMLILHLFNLWLAVRLLKPGAALLAVPRLGWASLVFCALLGRVVATRMDHLVVTLTLVCVWAGTRALSRDGARERLNWAALGGLLGALGVMVKLVPGVGFLAVLVGYARSNAPDRLRLAAIGCGAAGLLLLALNLPVVAFAGARYLESFRYHTLRGVQIESLYAGVLMLFHALGLPARVEESFGSANLETSLTPAIKLLSPLLFVACCAWICTRRWRAEPRSLALCATALLLGYMLTSRVFSPQYLIWIAAPLLAAGALDEPGGLWRAGVRLLSFVALLSQLIYPQGYPVLKAFHPLAVLLLDLRNVCLIWLLFGSVRLGLAQRNT
ncbi:MAG TPA: glycosyltransferase 87 family protein [Polyangiales bacterium]|nr:glycosyltransferase 87 family protein [Polyangiales bacterium]